MEYSSNSITFISYKVTKAFNRLGTMVIIEQFSHFGRYNSCMGNFSKKYLSILSIAVLAACNNGGLKKKNIDSTVSDMIVTDSDILNIENPISVKPDTAVYKPGPEIVAVNDTLDKDSIKVDSMPILPKTVDSLRMVGQLILDEKLIASDDPVTYRLFDSLVANKVRDRQFYFKVFNKIMGRADGALSEAIGVYSRKFIEKHTKDFFIFSASFNTIGMETWASQLGIELFLSEDHPKDAYHRTSKLIRENCSSCNAKTLKRLEEFNAMVLLTIKENEVKKK